MICANCSQASRTDFCCSDCALVYHARRGPPTPPPHQLRGPVPGVWILIQEYTGETLGKVVKKRGRWQAYFPDIYGIPTVELPGSHPTRKAAIAAVLKLHTPEE